MNPFTYIKNFFKKELEDIVAPLENIQTDITNFIKKQEANIEKDADKIKVLLKSNETRVSNNIKASTIVKNLETLLGKGQ